ncbi:MAG: WD40 repeat domain-containing protein, partial [Caldilineaceae bacterium]|nr:WD40 repeat domain-containing protein [Caldilineaceae bacterium]
ATFSPDGSALLISGRQAEQPVAQVLAFPSLNVQLTLDQFTSYYLYGASFAPNGSYILTQQDDNTASVWRVDNGDEVLTLPAAEVAWLPDSSGVIAATPNGSSLIQYWDLQQAKVIREFTQPTASDFYPHAIHVTPDQQQVVLFGWDDQTYVAQSWDLQTGTFLTKDELDPSVTIAPDGRLLAYGLDDNVILRDLVTHQVVMTGTGHSFGVYQVAFSPDGQRLASVGGDGAVRIWSVSGTGADAQISTPITVQATRVDALAFAPDQPLLLTSDGWRISGWHTTSSAEPLLTVSVGPKRLSQLTFAPRGGYFITVGDGALRVWSENFQEEWLTVNAPPSGLSNRTVAQLSPDSHHIALATGTNVEIYDVTTQAVIAAHTPLTEVIHGLTFSPDGAWLAAYGDSTVATWAITDERPPQIRRIVTGTIDSVTLGPDGKAGAVIVRVATDLPDFQSQWLARVFLWHDQAPTLHPVTREMPTYLAIDTLAFAPDGATLLVSGATYLSEGGSDHLIRVWDIAADALRFGLDFGPETAVQYTPDGRQLLVVRRAGISLWRVQDGTAVTTIDAGDRVLR